MKVLSKLLGLIMLCLVLSLSAQAKQFGLVVGVNKYQHGGSASLPDLEGAVNDAVKVAEALRETGVDLPDEHILLDKKATLKNFKEAWATIIKQANGGDTIIFTFAGHGGQENEVSEPFDEKDKDGMDETLMFHDFDPGSPDKGRINDDALFKLFADASNLRILFVADSCHSGGLVRSALVGNQLPTRSPGLVYDIPTTEIDHSQAEQGDEEYDLDHVTMITATDKDSLKVSETMIEDRPHGALSWFFSEAIAGAADSDKNNILTRKEIGEYVRAKVATHMNQTQLPNVLPRSNSQAVFDLPSIASQIFTQNTQAASDKIAVKLEGLSESDMPTDIDIVHLDSYQLLLRGSKDSIDVYNHTGDFVAKIDNNKDTIQKLLGKYRLLKAIDQAYNNTAKPLEIELKQGNGRHTIGKSLDFSFAPGNTAYNAFALFDLAGDGTLQFLYPLRRYDDSLQIRDRDLPFELNDIEVTEPVGSDHLVAIFCREPQKSLIGILEASDQRAAPEPKLFLESFNQNDCQIGRYSFFTRK